MPSSSRAPTLPTLRPPNPQYVDEYIKANSASAPDSRGLRTLASPGGGGSPAAGSSDEQVYAAPRLFEEMAATAEPDDMASFYHGLTHGQGAFAAAMRRAAEERLVYRRRLVLLCGVQSVGATLYLFLQSWEPAQLAAGMLLVSTGVTLVSSAIGCVGAWYEMRNALHWYYLSQLWALGVTVQQWVHDLYDAERTTILCDEPGGGRDPRCWLNGSESLQVFALLAVTAVCLLSIFYANMLSESLQDARSGEIQKALVRLTWVMQKKSAVGMQRVEEFIHREFEELVELGWLKLKPAEG